MRKQFLAIYFIFPVFMLVAGCNPLVTVSPPVIQTIVATTDSVISENATENVCATVWSIIDRAETAAREAEFALAHRLCATAYEIIRVEEERTGMEIAGVDGLYRSLSKIYVELLPPTYADSVDEALAMMVLEGQMERAYGAANVATDDTVVARIMACMRGASYTVPMIYNERVLRALAFYTRVREGQMDRWFARARIYVPMISRVIADAGLPSDLLWLPLIESGFNPHAYSHAHASGIWQFIASTGSRYGLRRSYWVDERRDPIKSTVAALAYLRDLHKEFKDWHIALAAYNCGEGGMRRAVNAAGVSDYWALTLPKETMEYVPRFLAAVLMARSPACVGIAQIDSSGLFPDTVLISDCIDLGTIARGLGVTVDTLERLNPHLLRWCTPPDIDRVTLYLPSGTADEFRRFASRLTPGQKVKWQQYRVVPGDNLNTIARRFGTSVEAIRTVNRLKTTRIVAGNNLHIPIAGSVQWAAPVAEPATMASADGAVRYRVQQGETITQIAAMFNVNVPDISRWNRLINPDAIRAGDILKLYPKGATGQVRKPASRPTAVSAGLHNSGNVAGAADTILYAVKSGDNLSKIADLFGSTASDIASLNALGAERIIRAGDLLKVVVRSPARQSQTVDNAETAIARSVEKAVLYEIRKGDTLWGIAQTFGVPLQSLYAANGLNERSQLVPGSKLKILLKEER